ncbi:branched-chain amino acid ABC transporter ATP-binding protein/permease [Variovorax sp. 770b2]|uniref:branched-chain amino acid ABC transporter ATP-binding protein/permease n=1 Tax=Variovorax sp. 770b2 TaxID=1566271 RepID=UPI0008E8F71A|nr:branched-chain amino acid ABC transporter ATP-binding protein/permease [Variovorax sp. 770b2]SFP26085.1 ABC-type branched-chain amino acid transport system, ATPase component [Variovorax sp. 770b2]
MKKLFGHPVCQVAAVLLVLSFLTLVTHLPLGRVTQIAIYVLYAAGIGLLVGYLGLVPFGGSVFFGVASYAAALSLLHWFGDINEFAGLAFSVLFTVLVALPVGALILRRKGLYFSLLSLACTQICFEIAYKWTDLTGGENGLQRVPRPVLDSALGFHVFVVLMVLGTLWLMWRVVHSPLGRLFQAVRDNEQRAASLGYDVYRVKLAGFVLSAAITGLAGGMLALFMRGVYANPLSWEHAADPLLMTVLGGMHHFVGAMWGAILFIVLEDQLGALLNNWWLVFAPILMLVTLLAPEGIHGLIRRAWGGKGWTLVRGGIPPRPARITPYAPEAGAGAVASREPLLTVRGLTKKFGSLAVASGYDFDVHQGTLHSFIGPNGAGKTTFFNMLSGVVVPDSGQVRFLGHDITHLPMHKRIRLGLARSFQIVSVFTHLTAFENVRVAVQATQPSPLAMWRDAQASPAANDRTWSILEAVGLADKAGELCTDLSHGERRLLEIGITLATQARLLLLDEPLAGLGEADRVRVAALIRALARTHAVVLIEHDIDRVLALSDRITVLHQGRLIADGKPAEVAANPEVVRAYLGAPPEGMNEAAAARVARPASPRLLLDARGLAAGYGGGRILDGVDLRIGEGEAVALLGRNGVGKTTLLRAMYGMLPVDEGTVQWDGKPIQNLRPFEINRLGISVVPEGRRLFPNLTVLDNLLIAVRKGGMPLEEIFELFPRLKTIQKSRAESISGGERQMVAIARALVAPSRLILLDEPFEGLAPAVVNEVMAAILKLRGRVAMVLVEHHAEQVLSIVDRAVVLVNGRVAYEGDAAQLAADAPLQARLLGLVDPQQREEAAQAATPGQDAHGARATESAI